MQPVTGQPIVDPHLAAGDLVAITEALSLTAHTYTDFSGFAFNQTELEELTANSKEFAFERFV